MRGNKRIHSLFFLLLISPLFVSYAQSKEIDSITQQEINKIYKENNIHQINKEKQKSGREKQFLIFSVLISEYMKYTMEEYKIKTSPEFFKKYHYQSAKELTEVLLNRFSDGSTETKGSTTHKEAIIINQRTSKVMGIPYDVWLFADVFDVLSESMQEEIWQEMLVATSEGTSDDELMVLEKLWMHMQLEAKYASAEKKEKIDRWLKRMRKIPFIILLEEIKGDKLKFN